MNVYLTQEEKIFFTTSINSIGIVPWKSSNTKIGEQAICGLSGGERKHVPIGVDSAITFQTMKSLNNLLKNGKNGICIVHPPSSEMFGSIDRVLLLEKSKVVYHGYVQDLAIHLPKHTSTGYSSPEHNNIADFILPQVQQVNAQPDYSTKKWDEYMRTNNQTSFIPENINSQLKQQLPVNCGMMN